MKHYTFQVFLGGFGNTPEEAWEDVREGIAVDGLGGMDDSVVAEEEVEGFDE